MPPVHDRRKHDTDNTVPGDIEIRRATTMKGNIMYNETTVARCACAHNTDGTTTRFLCPAHAENDPCLAIASVTGKRRRGSIVRGRCTSCGWDENISQDRNDEMNNTCDLCGVVTPWLAFEEGGEWHTLCESCEVETRPSRREHYASV